MIRDTGIGSVIAWMALIMLILAALNTMSSDAQAHGYGTVTYCHHGSTQNVRTGCIIRHTFHTRGAAVRVAWCESRFDVNARNGQHRGIFQMGWRERARFGHGRTVMAQARAAHRYYRLAGWGPWECKP